MIPKEDLLVRLLRLLSYRKVLLINISGDYGGQLLHMGLKKKLRELNIEFIEIEPSLFISKASYYLAHLIMKAYWILRKLSLTPLAKLLLVLLDIIWMKPVLISIRNTLKDSKNTEPKINAVIIHGSGTLSDITPMKLAVFRVIQKIFTKIPIVVAPQSYWFPKSDFKDFILNNRSNTLILFAREYPSYITLRNSLNELRSKRGILLLLSHDTAFYLAKEDLPIIPSQKYILINLREDKESAVPEYVRKIIAKFCKACKETCILGDVGKAESFYNYVKIVASAKVVISDRLHVAILGAILGKETYLIGNIYHKNMGVYEYSLSKYDNAGFLSVRDPEFVKRIEKVILRNCKDSSLQ